MAIYHLEAKIVSRGTGRSAVAASAYMSCSKLYNDYDGILHDYTRKQGLVWEHILLPEYAPAAWQEREMLWNAMEKNEKTKDSRLARELVVALPVELEQEAQITLLTEYIQNSFVADGMCADAAIHDTDGHNPHAHILLTVRPLDEQGKWQYKTEKEYRCVKDGMEQGFTAAEFQAAQKDGWEKQYLYIIGKKKAYVPPSEAKTHGYVRVDKHPKSTRFGRQNPVSERWNSEEQLVLWREAWADTVNIALERNGHDVRIDHRSHAERGLTEQPTIHEGVFARLMEREGMVSDRCELNRQIRADNKLLRELKAQVSRLVKAIQNTIPAIANALETVREMSRSDNHSRRSCRRFIAAKGTYYHTVHQSTGAAHFPPECVPPTCFGSFNRVPLNTIPFHTLCVRYAPRRSSSQPLQRLLLRPYLRAGQTPSE